MGKRRAIRRRRFARCHKTNCRVSPIPEGFVFGIGHTCIMWPGTRLADALFSVPRGKPEDRSRAQSVSPPSDRSIVIAPERQLCAASSKASG